MSSSQGVTIITYFSISRKSLDLEVKKQNQKLVPYRTSLLFSFTYLS